MIGFTEILLILLVVVILFGASNIPKLARSIGEGLKEFKKGIKEAKEIDNPKIDSLADKDKIEQDKGK